MKYLFALIYFVFSSKLQISPLTIENWKHDLKNKTNVRTKVLLILINDLKKKMFFDKNNYNIIIKLHRILLPYLWISVFRIHHPYVCFSIYLQK